MRPARLQSLEGSVIRGPLTNHLAFRTFDSLYYIYTYILYIYCLLYSSFVWASKLQSPRHELVIKWFAGSQSDWHVSVRRHPSPRPSPSPTPVAVPRQFTLLYILDSAQLSASLTWPFGKGVAKYCTQNEVIKQFNILIIELIGLGKPDRLR